MQKPKILVFASGSANGGGSGFENLVISSRSSGMLQAEIVGVVSEHPHGSVQKRAEALSVPFYHFKRPWSDAGYAVLAYESGADYFASSGWRKMIRGLDPRRTFNIHPGPMHLFGGKGYYGHRVHEAVIAAFKAGEITHTAVCMHFVTKEYDKGPCFFRCRIPIYSEDTPQTLAARVRAIEHGWQPFITNLVVHGLIAWDGTEPASLKVPSGYAITRQHAR